MQPITFPGATPDRVRHARVGSDDSADGRWPIHWTAATVILSSLVLWFGLFAALRLAV